MKLIYGVGINDADYTVQLRKTLYGTGNSRVRKLIWQCPYYSRWQSMLQRCYSNKYLLKNSSYLGCSVCEEWLTFSKFKKWMEQQDWEGKDLDKDILGDGKLYSPQTCVFIQKEINTFLCSSLRKRGSCRIGVSFRIQTGKYEAKIKDPFSGKTIWLGSYLSEDDAYSAWLENKLAFADTLCLKLNVDTYLTYKIKEHISNLK